MLFALMTEGLDPGARADVERRLGLPVGVTPESMQAAAAEVVRGVMA